jgi:hypothetical protein
MRKSHRFDLASSNNPMERTENAPLVNKLIATPGHALQRFHTVKRVMLPVLELVLRPAASSPMVQWRLAMAGASR